ncbi:MAG TPA: metallophosphoesterase [Candidatus Blautia intestinavium]|nr:metallophosphoesterase [Candidatus Blautia intestinavium]
MKILIVSDTHGRDSGLEKAVERESPFDMLIHCGDVEGREDYIEALAECPCCIVSGNNDFFSDLPREDVVSIAGHNFLVTHGHYYGVSMELAGIEDEARSRNLDGVFFGHTHRPVLKVKNGFLLLNPGSLSYPRQQGRRPSYAVLWTDEQNRITGEIRYL